MSGRLYYPDVSSWQTGVSLAGWGAVMAKATEGTSYRNPAYAGQRAEAARRGARFGAYHFLHAGNGAAQADWCHSVTGSGVPLMIDFEPTAATVRDILGLPPADAGPDRQPLALAAAVVPRLPEHLETGHLARLDLGASVAEPRIASRPSVQDVSQFTDRYRNLGGVCHLLYFPRWYWQILGSPALNGFISRGLELVTSNYSGDPENDAAAGWQAYGEMPRVKTWQYTASGTVNGMVGVDVNAFRGSGNARTVPQLSAELWQLWTTGKTGQAPGPFPPPVAQRPVITLGYSGPIVTYAQQRLNAHGARPALKTDGEFGPATRTATEAFQKGRKLTADGAIGPKTWAALDTKPAAGGKP
jgi:hypothetical protein